MVRLMRGNGDRALGPKDAKAQVEKKRYLRIGGRFCHALKIIFKCLTLNNLVPMQDWHCECIFEGNP